MCSVRKQCTFQIVFRIKKFEVELTWACKKSRPEYAYIEILCKQATATAAAAEATEIDSMKHITPTIIPPKTNTNPLKW